MRSGEVALTSASNMENELEVGPALCSPSDPRSATSTTWPRCGAWTSAGKQADLHSLDLETMTSRLLRASSSVPSTSYVISSLYGADGCQAAHQAANEAMAARNLPPEHQAIVQARRQQMTTLCVPADAV